MGIQIKIFVGRRIVAKAAATRDWGDGGGLRLSSTSSASEVDCHGHPLRAKIVKSVSKQLERVREEQNHCQGFRIVRIN